MATCGKFSKCLSNRLPAWRVDINCDESLDSTTFSTTFGSYLRNRVLQIDFQCDGSTFTRVELEIYMRYIWVINKCEINRAGYWLIFSAVVNSISKLNFVLVHTNPKRLRADSVTRFDFYRRNGILTYLDELSFTCVSLRIVSLLFYTFKSYWILSSPHFLKVQLRCLFLADWPFGRTILKNNFGPMVSLPLSPLEIWKLGWKERSQKEDCLNDLRGTSSWILQTEETDGAGLQVSSIPC